MNRFIALPLAALLGLAIIASPANADPGDSPSDPIVVASPGDVPQGAVEDAVSTYVTPNACDTTRSWVNTEPATTGRSHEESRYKRDVPGTQEQTHREWGVETRTRDWISSEAHKQFRYERQIPAFTKKWKVIKVYAENVYDYQRYSWNPRHNDPDVPPPFPGPGWQPNNKPYDGGPVGAPFKAGGGQSWFYWSQTLQHSAGEIYPLGPWYFLQDAAPTQNNGQTIGVPFSVGGTMFQYILDGFVLEENGTTTEDSGWVDSAPAGDGWALVDERWVDDDEVPAHWSEWSGWSVLSSGLTVEPTLLPDTDDHEYRLTGPVTIVDQEATPGFTQYYVLGGEPSLVEADATWLRAGQAPAEGWTKFDERTVTDSVGTPEVVTYYAWTDGVECEKPEGYEHSDSVEKCDGTSLVTTTTTVVGTPVQATDGTWTIEETSTATSSVEHNADGCTTEPPCGRCGPDEPEEPNNPPKNTPDVPTVVDGGLESINDSESPSMTVLAVVGAIFIVSGAGLLLRR